jgi:signal transduction histidine kinase
MNSSLALAPAPAALRVLHVEDSEVDHLMMQALLEQAGLQVTWLRVETLEAFVEALEQDWDAIICDYHLPTASGVDMLRYLREGGQPIPFLLVSGEIGEETAVAAMREGASDYLLKTHLTRLAPALLQAVKAAEAQRQRAAADAALRDSQRQLQALARHLQSRVEAERAAMARELHDDVGSALTALKFDLAWLARHAQDETLVVRAQRASSTLDLAIEASRRLMLNLRPPILQEGLTAALQWLVQQFERQHEALVLRLALPGEAVALDEERALVAYRFVQEALHNVAKHAQAGRVDVEVSQAGGVLTVEVRDDGVGLPPGTLQGVRGLGLRGLQERAAAVGAWVDVSSRPGAGTQLLLSLPLQGAAPMEDADAAWLEEAR